MESNYVFSIVNCWTFAPKKFSWLIVNETSFLPNFALIHYSCLGVSCTKLSATSKLVVIVELTSTKLGGASWALCSLHLCCQSWLSCLLFCMYLTSKGWLFPCLPSPTSSTDTWVSSTCNLSTCFPLVDLVVMFILQDFIALTLANEMNVENASVSSAQWV